MRSLAFFAFVVSCCCLLSCVNNSKLRKYSKRSMEPVAPAFIVYTNGDTIKGKKLKIKKKEWLLDGKPVNKTSVAVVQDRDGYRINNATRILTGKISLFFHQQDYLVGVDSKTGLKNTATRTTLYLTKDGGFYTASYNGIMNAISDCPAAVKIADRLFNDTYSKRNPMENLNNYPRAMRILKVYNAECP